jgi:hypothetical protein
VDKDELFPDASVHPAYRIGGTLLAVRDILQAVWDNLAWEPT